MVTACSWLNAGKPIDKSQYIAKTNKTWDAGVRSWVDTIDITPYVNAGAKYIYSLGQYFISMNATKPFAPQHATAALLKYDNNTWSWAGSTAFGPYYDYFNIIATDSGKATNGSFYSRIAECCLPIEPFYADGYKYLCAQSMHESGPFDDMDPSYFYYPNTVIDKPLIYLIYEQ